MDEITKAIQGEAPWRMMFSDDNVLIERREENNNKL